MPSTPQNEAHDWLSSDFYIDAYSDEQKIQRYALAVLYYNVNADVWDNYDVWMTNIDECSWWNNVIGTSCSNGGGVVELFYWEQFRWCYSCRNCIVVEHTWYVNPCLWLSLQRFKTLVMMTHSVSFNAMRVFESCEHQRVRHTSIRIRPLDQIKYVLSGLYD